MKKMHDTFNHDTFNHDTFNIVHFPPRHNKQTPEFTLQGSTVDTDLDTMYNRSIEYIYLMYKQLESLLTTFETLETYRQYASTKEGDSMDWQEKYLEKLDHDISEMKRSLRDTEERIAQMINQTLTEMRDRDNQRHAEILALRNDIQAIRNDNVATRWWIIGMVISAIGVAVAAIAGIVSIVSK
ncbi:hypothetical protein BBF96_01525 [Anoxybacter fermentans]|uniref:Uncharacterized protein n=1 Tax=Anoxybacter fermentans TaxID=1323375 RepID=A0A3S9SVB2_9FIRM|nr:hypothetical protein [Anoxybacter fermentans]AZR72190.1 hypothetical protein BBF96_01525 [Anoxybacter fermentans]